MSGAVDPGPEPARRTRTPRAMTRRRAVVIAAVVAAVLVVVLVWALAQRGDPADDGASPTAVASASPTPSESATPTAGATPEPSVEPTATAPGEGPVAVPEVPTLPEPLTPRPLTEEAPIGAEAVARVTALEAVEGQPQGVGEIAGPALRFTIELTNTGTATITARDAVVNVTYGAQDTPATEISGPGRVPFAGDIAPGATGSATLVFLVPVEERGDVSVSLEYRAGAPIAVFEGSASAAPQG